MENEFNAQLLLHFGRAVKGKGTLRKLSRKKGAKATSDIKYAYPDLSECTFGRKQIAAVKHVTYSRARGAR